MDIELKYSEILRRNIELAKGLSGKPYEIALLSNVVVAQAKEILEYTLRAEGIRPP